MSRATKRKQKAIQRAQQSILKGGNEIPTHVLQAALAKLQKGNSGTALFSPGKPLETQPGVNPSGLPRQWSFPIAYNVSGVDRTLNQQDIPPFAQLRNLADLYEGIALCEKVWLDLIPNLQLKIQLRPELVAQGEEESKYQKIITAYTTFFEKPDGMNDLHSWLRMAVIEQLQIDALYIYKQKDRAGRLQALKIVAGDTLKPLLDDWGNIVGYQQFPWGLPGEQYNLTQMIYFREAPRASTPYGKSRIERILMRVNQALRKEKKDLAYFTEGNQPFAIMEVPEASNWTPDQIESFEVMWNALIAGNAQQQVRVKFAQPGMKYTPLEQYQLLSDFDQFILNIATAVYGISMADLSFTGDIHKSADAGQQNVMFRRTLDPTVSMYAMLLTSIIRDDFNDPRFMVTFAGYEEAEDISALASAYSELTGSGILGLTNAAKLMKLPEDPDAPHIGRIIITKEGPIFLDDMASDMMRNAQQKAQLAGYQLAATNPQQQPSDKEVPPGEEKQANDGQGNNASKSPPTNQSDQEDDSESEKDAPNSGGADDKQKKAELKRWQEVAIRCMKSSKPIREFASTIIDDEEHEHITIALSRCGGIDEVKAVFTRASEGELTHWQDGDREIQKKLADLKAQGVQRVTWKAHKDCCDACSSNDSVTKPLGTRFASGAMIPPNHPNCICEAVFSTEEE
jgi:hypothetical protein